MLVKDEADVIEHTVRYLLTQVDEVIVADNLSGDGTTEILASLVDEGAPVSVVVDEEVGYYQARKTTRLAQLALERGHSWVVPCDADELWHANDLRPLRQFLAGTSPDVVVLGAPLYNHVCTPGDLKRERNPFRRLEYRIRERIGSSGTEVKVACRLHPALEIEQGNHGAKVPGATRPIEAGVSIRHFPWRSEEQFLRKIRNGTAAYAAYEDRPPTMGQHWLAFGTPPDEDQALEWFRNWAVYERDRPEVLYDPAPWSAG